MIRPQMKKKRRSKAIDAIAKGDDGNHRRRRAWAIMAKLGSLTCTRKANGVELGRCSAPVMVIQAFGVKGHPGCGGTGPWPGFGLSRLRRGSGPRNRWMNRYPLVKYAILGVALLIGLLYTVPNPVKRRRCRRPAARHTLKVDAGR